MRLVVGWGLFLSVAALLAAGICWYDAWLNKGMARHVGPEAGVGRGLDIAGDGLRVAARWLFRFGAVGLVVFSAALLITTLV